MPVLAQIFNLKQPVSIGFTLVLANAAPAVFGAGGMLLSMSGQERLRSKLVWLLLPLVFVSYLIAATMGVMVLAYAVALHSMGLWGLYRWFLR
jgi:undecaprenyl pyrophosphate phosphatase UppP